MSGRHLTATVTAAMAAAAAATEPRSAGVPEFIPDYAERNKCVAGKHGEREALIQKETKRVDNDLSSWTSIPTGGLETI